MTPSSPFPTPERFSPGTSVCGSRREGTSGAALLSPVKRTAKSVPAESEVRNAARPSVPGPSRPSGLGPAGELGGPGTGRCPDLKRPSAVAAAVHWLGPGLEAAANLSPPPPPLRRRWRRPLGGAQTSPAAHFRGPTLRGLRETPAQPAGTRRLWTLGVAGREEWRPLGCRAGGPLGPSRAREGGSTWTRALPPLGLGAPQMRAVG